MSTIVDTLNSRRLITTRELIQIQTWVLDELNRRIAIGGATAERVLNVLDPDQAGVTGQVEVPVSGKDRRGRESGTSKGNGEVRYINPNDSSQTWGGRGKRPKWFLELLERGFTLESLTPQSYPQARDERVVTLSESA